MTYAQTLAVLADPTRRRIVERLRTGPRTAGRLARGLPVSRPAVSQHLRALARAGLVACDRRGTRRIYRIRPEGLAALRRWLDGLWGDALTAFEEHLADEQKSSAAAQDD